MWISTDAARRAAEAAESAVRDRLPVREEMRPARGLLIGLTLSVVFWLALLVVWLAL
ncbi:hypothetical protein [Aureimonas sp. ME7]|uniref:hypothetical protein n=1 Tax=Aureimonas sp. ME7 TaxID=2744252 RepID=UPI0015F423BD|nr:hypothetical protein [Aureimonas sp. ME7]